MACCFVKHTWYIHVISQTLTLHRLQNSSYFSVAGLRFLATQPLFTRFAMLFEQVGSELFGTIILPLFIAITLVLTCAFNSIHRPQQRILL